MLIIGITTAPRGRHTAMEGQAAPERVDYAAATKRAILDSAQATRTGITIHMFETGALSLVGNSDRLLRECIKRSGSSPFLQCQDDLLLCSNAIGRIAEVAAQMPEDAAYVSFYTPYETPDPFTENRVLPCEPQPGCLCNLWNPEAAGDFLETDLPKRRGDFGTGRGGMAGWDIMLGQWIRRQARWMCYRHIPCLVQHAGEVSSVGKGGGVRRTANFRQDWDAMGVAV